MRQAMLEALACPLTRAPFDLDPIRVVADEVVEGFLVSRDRHEVRPVVAGVAVLPRDLRAHLRASGSVYRRTPINDPRLARFLLGQAGGGHDVVPFAEIVAHYRDLALAPPAGYDVTADPDDAALGALLAQTLAAADRGARALDVGSGVGRGVFALCAHVGAALGLDRSVACTRRARNIAVTREHFFLPAPKGSGAKEIPLDLDGLARTGAEFAVADPHALPVLDDAFDLVLVRAGDSRGAWPDPAAVVAEALRTLRPAGRLLWHRDLDACVAPEALAAARRVEPFRCAVPA